MTTWCEYCCGFNASPRIEQHTYDTHSNTWHFWLLQTNDSDRFWIKQFCC